jgi:hypothetical protein
MKAQRGGKYLSVPYTSTLSLTSMLDWHEWSKPRLPGEREPLPISQKAGWASGSVWSGTEKFRPLAGV